MFIWIFLIAILPYYLVGTFLILRLAYYKVQGKIYEGKLPLLEKRIHDILEENKSYRFRNNETIEKNKIEIEEKLKALQESLKKDSIDELQAKTHLAMLDMENRKFRQSVTLTNTTEKVNHVLDEVLNNYMMTEYYNNPKYAKSNGDYILPEINTDVRKRDLSSIYRKFRLVASNELMADLDTIYKVDSPSFEAYFVSNYLAPRYNKSLDEMKENYRINSEARLRKDAEDMERYKALNPSEDVENYNEESTTLMSELDNIDVPEYSQEEELAKKRMDTFKGLIHRKYGSKNNSNTPADDSMMAYMKKKNKRHDMTRFDFEGVFATLKRLERNGWETVGPTLDHEKIIMYGEIVAEGGFDV